MSFEEIINLISTDPLKSLILLESALIAKKLTNAQFKKISKKFKDAQKVKKFGFSPSDELASNLKKIDSTPAFLKLKSLIKSHPSLRLVRIGLYLETLNREGATRIVDQIRDEIYNIFPDIGLKILDIGSTGLMIEVIDSLENLKENLSLSEFDVIRHYEYIIKRMNFISIYVDNEDFEANIELRINKKMSQQPDIFYVIATGNASQEAMLTIAKMNNASIIREKGYMIIQPRITPHGETRKQYIWTFYKFV